MVLCGLVADVVINLFIGANGSSEKPFPQGYWLGIFVFICKKMGTCETYENAGTVWLYLQAHDVV